ncbi:hypothetical protein BGZ60DRAFT_160091 [Tricladium varicosporioides]|nr:hypothetical protein BGZ60DRAFT_160091 [Hymenoscyphus varicosporioides]
MISSTPPGPDRNTSLTYVIPCGIFAIIALLFCSARFYTRLRPTVQLRLDDYLIGVGTILAFTGTSLGVAASNHGWGRLSYYVSAADQVKTFKYLFAMQLLWILGVVIIRISVAMSLLRLTIVSSAVGYEKLWRGTLWAMICIQLLNCAGWMIIQFFNCRPLRASWEPVVDVVCWDPKYTSVYGYVSNALMILTDFLLATMPIKLITTLNRSTREKVLIACLMALGLLATGIAAYKMYITKYFFIGDFLQTSVWFSIWCKLEELVGIIAACAPSLKSPVEKLLRRVGVLSKHHSGEITRPSFVISLKNQIPPSPINPQMASGSKVGDLESNIRSEAGLVENEHKDWESGTTEVRTATSHTSESTETHERDH